MLKFVDDQIRLLWAGLIENQYMDSLNTVPQMLNVTVETIGNSISATKVNKIMAEDSLKMITFIEDVTQSKL